MRTPLLVRNISVGPFKGFAIYGDRGRNPLLAVQRGPQGWLVMTRKRQWMSPRLKRWSQTKRKENHA